MIRSTIAALAILASGMQAQAAPRAFVLDTLGQVISCEHAATDTEVEFCSGEIDAPSVDPTQFEAE